MSWLTGIGRAATNHCMNAHSHLDADVLIADLCAKARIAQRTLTRMTDAQKATALIAAAAALESDEDEILAANARDLEAAKTKGLSKALLDRLMLSPDRLASVVSSVRKVIELPDPVGEVIDTSTPDNGLLLSRIRVPIGVIGIIYESRPNVTADAAVLCVRAGNAVLLRGGSEAVQTNRAIHAALAKGLEAGGAPADAIQLIPTQDRAGGRLDAGGGSRDRHDHSTRRQGPG